MYKVGQQSNDTESPSLMSFVESIIGRILRVRHVF